MPTQNGLNSSHLERHLTEAQSLAEKGDYAAAVGAVREAKSLAPKNVYVLAFEKQAEQLSALDALPSSNGRSNPPPPRGLPPVFRPSDPEAMRRRKKGRRPPRSNG